MFVSKVGALGLRILAACTLFVCSGCGGPDYGSPVSVSGTVSVSDKPLANALVTYNCTEGREAEFKSFVATTGADGKYALDAVYPGPYDILVSEVTPDVEPGMESAVAGQDLIPEGGPLKTEVGSAAHTFDIKLKRGRVPRQ